MVDTDIEHGAIVSKQNHKQPYSFCLEESAGPGGVRRVHKYSLITYDILLDNIFQILDTENVSVMQIIPCLEILMKKKGKVISPTLSKSQQCS